VVLNPINLSTSRLMSIRDKNDIRLIFEVALHECAHLLGGSYHGDGFVKAFDRAVTEMLEHWNVAKRIAKNIKVRGVIKKVRRDKIPERVEMIVQPLTYSFAHVVVVDDSSSKALIDSLGVDERQLEFFLEDEELENFLSLIEDEHRALWNEGAVFSTTLSYPWVRRKIAQVSKDEVFEEPGHILPVNVYLNDDGTILFEPADPRHRGHYRRHYNISPASTRVVLARREEDQLYYLKTLFFENHLLAGWPYTEKTFKPADLVEQLYKDGYVTIPLDSDRYDRVLDDAVVYGHSFMIRDGAVVLNVRKTPGGTFLVHPANDQVYHNYGKRFDARDDGDGFELELMRKRENEQLTSQFSSWNIMEVDRGYSSEVSVPTALFERWLYSNELQVRRPDWEPEMAGQCQRACREQG